MRDPSRVQVTGPLERFAEGFRLKLAGRGYAPDSAAQPMQVVACLSRWMVVEGVEVSELTPEQEQQFVQWRRTAGYRQFTSSRALWCCWRTCVRWE